MRKMAFSLPGIWRALNTTVSPDSMTACPVLAYGGAGKRGERFALAA